MEKQTIQLNPNDPRLGSLSATEKALPDVDILGNPYRREHAIIRHIGKGRVVIIPRGFVGEIEVIETPAPAPEAPPEPAKRGGRREADNE